MFLNIHSKVEVFRKRELHTPFRWRFVLEGLALVHRLTQLFSHACFERPKVVEEFQQTLRRCSWYRCCSVGNGTSWKVQNQPDNFVPFACKFRKSTCRFGVGTCEGKQFRNRFWLVAQMLAGTACVFTEWFAMCGLGCGHSTISSCTVVRSVSLQIHFNNFQSEMFNWAWKCILGIEQKWQSRKASGTWNWSLEIIAIARYTWPG